MEEALKRRQEEIEQAMLAHAVGTLPGQRMVQGGHPVVIYTCQCGTRFGSSGHDARLVHCHGCGMLWKVNIEG